MSCVTVPWHNGAPQQYFWSPQQHETRNKGANIRAQRRKSAIRASTFLPRKITM